ncbi:hypothetical protein D3C87_299360 [compost metagenome]|uniref:hypothetical protein n=1 Tax=Pedobacter sp. ok626 TaxID=1761882 RepID=UPI0008886010|nr:hypothetical protein [Pedobacter sp. ok626]SDJ81511.1 hypothetical protein SAMN04487898_104342 [Pedobacter sp. ok626]
MSTESYNKILTEFKEKASLKQAIYRNTTEVFGMLKKQLAEIALRLQHDYNVKDPSVEINFKEHSHFEGQLKFSGDMLMVSMHTNIFSFDPSHSMFQSQYIKDDPSLNYCGIIYLHNFLADSIKYNRLADEGTLIARILINKDKHFMVEGEGVLDSLYQDFANNLVTEEKLTDIIERSILFCLDSDLMIPPFAQVKDVTLNQKQSMLVASGFPTSKNIGYQFKSEIEQNNNI